MCWCTPSIRTPFCGKATCVPPAPTVGEFAKANEQKAQSSIEKLRQYIGKGSFSSASDRYSIYELLSEIETELKEPAAPAPQPAWAQLIHYPDCWDTAAYPTLGSAVSETLAWAGCSVCKSAAPQPEPVGEAGTMPGTTGFTMACFRAVDVPVGTKLFTSPSVKFYGGGRSGGKPFPLKK